MAFSQFFVLSPRGDTIISRDYRGDVVKGTAEIFFRKVKFWKGDAPPAFNIDGINFLYVKKGGLYFVATTKFNVSPVTIIELLNRITRVFKDYCGVLSEESMRKNFILIYELLDEVLDYGYAQGTSTEMLKTYVHNEAVPVLAPHKFQVRIAGDVGLGALSSMPRVQIPAVGAQNTAPSSSVHKPISIGTGSRGKGQKNEIFVDILERLTLTFNSTGYVQHSAIDGCIQMKSYLSGNPALRIALNEDLVIGRSAGAGQYGAVVLDDCNFHECVRLDEFESSRTLSLVPPDGEFVVMNYRVTGEFRAPFRVFPLVEEMTTHKLEVVVKVRADIPDKNYGSNVVVRFNVPRTAGTVLPLVPAGVQGQQAEYVERDRSVVWQIKKFQGASEHMLKTTITLTQPISATTRKEIGPISVQFEIPMYNVSNLQVRYLRIAETSRSYKPFRWVRYVTQSSSYVCRL